MSKNSSFFYATGHLIIKILLSEKAEMEKTWIIASMATLFQYLIQGFYNTFVKKEVIFQLIGQNAVIFEKTANIRNLVFKMSNYFKLIC